MTNRIKEFKNMVDHIADVPREVVESEKSITETSPYRQKYHVESESGSLGDPNGFSYFNGKYHLFYQWSPLAFSSNPHYTQHGWKHLISNDLVDWKDLGPAIESDTKYDRYGTYSGSALAENDRLLMLYTGNTWKNTNTKNSWLRVPYQVSAYMDKDNLVHRCEKPIIEDTLPGYTAHFRDPKVWKQDKQYYAIFGIQRKNLTGTAMIYTSKDFANWQSLGELKTPYDSLGYMWECPDYFDLDGKGVLIFCPQGLNGSGNKFQNIYQTCYLTGDKLSLPDTNFNAGSLHELDNGFDLYASQTMLTPDNRRILVSWMGLPETNYPTEKYHYTGCMTIPKELIFKDNVLYQVPIKELKDHRVNQEHISYELNCKKVKKELQNNSKNYELSINLENSEALIMDLFSNQIETNRFRIIFNKKKNEIMIDRSHSGKEISTEYGSVRTLDYDLSKEFNISIYTDTSSVELFINNGEKVFTSRIFPDESQTQVHFMSIKGKSFIEGNIYDMKR